MIATVNNLIEELQKIQNECGEYEVFCDCGDYNLMSMGNIEINHKMKLVYFDAQMVIDKK